MVFPAYNEEQYIRRGDRGLPDSRRGRRSPRRRQQLARSDGGGGRPQRAARVVSETRQGYGFALRRGLQEARGDIIILAEPDGTFIGRDVLKLLAYADDFDMVCGTRTTRELMWDQANMGWFLRIGNWAVAKMLQVLYGGPSLSDCGCTLRLTHRGALERIRGDLTVGGSHFLPEMVILGLKRQRLKIIEIPVNYRGRVGESKITGNLQGTLRTGFSMIGLIVKYRLK